MKILILVTLLSSILLFGCLQNNTASNSTTEINTTNTYIVPPTSTPTPQAATNIYVKDSPVAATSIEVELKKVTLVTQSGESQVIFEGSQRMTLDEKTTTRVASQKINSEQYAQIYLDLGNQATIHDANGTHNAIVSNTQIKSEINKRVENNQTMQIIIDIPIAQTVETNSQGNYTFAPKQETTSTAQIDAGIQLKTIGVISIDAENTLGITHSINPNLDANLNISTIIG